MSSCRGRVKRFVKWADQHGAPIALSYKSQYTYKTLVGGTITILSRLGMLAYFLVLVNNIINKDKTVTYKSVFKSANNDIQNYPITG